MYRINTTITCSNILIYTLLLTLYNSIVSLTPLFPWFFVHKYMQIIFNLPVNDWLNVYRIVSWNICNRQSIAHTWMFRWDNYSGELSINKLIEFTCFLLHDLHETLCAGRAKIISLVVTLQRVIWSMNDYNYLIQTPVEFKSLKKKVLNEVRAKPTINLSGFSKMYQK